tara:strand:+ start:5632 stop:6090 length:459 start_codon:yes stop_codon:yes gene_type:complete
MQDKYDYEKMSKEGFQCDCVAAGFCPLLQKEMTEPLHHLCQTSERHRTVFLRTAKKRGVHDNNVKKRYSAKMRKRTDLENTAEEAIKEMKAAGVDIDKQSEGLGDTIEKVLNKFGINQEKIEKILSGPGCGCSERKTWFNKIFSYNKDKNNE